MRERKEDGFPSDRRGTPVRQYGIGLTVGLINGILIIIFQSAYATLIFSGPLSAYLPQGIGIMLFGAAVMGLIMAVGSSFRGTVTAPQDAPSAIMATIAGSIALSMAPATSTQSMFTTVVMAIALTSIATGLFLLLLGWFNLGNLIRFIPYPVVGGFLAGTGWVLVKGAIGIMAEIPLSPYGIPALFQNGVLMKWLPGVLFAFVLFIAQRRLKHFLVMPILILLGIVLFYIILFATHTSITDAAKLGWLMPRLSGGISWKPLLLTSLDLVSWRGILEQSGNLATIGIISVISLLLNSSGLELIARKEIDLNRELRVTGLANMVSGLGGSATGYISLSLTALGYRLGSRTRISGIVSAGLCAIALLSGAAISTYFPKPLLGGLLFFLGFIFLVEWIYHAWFKLPKAEYFLVVLILITIGMFGFLEGMLLGMLISIVLFAVNYGQINVVKHTLSGKTFHSNVDRAAPYQRFLLENGDKLYILKLQGFIFFGTANNVLEQVKQRIHNPDFPPAQFIVLDFQLVTGLDSSALYSFEKMKLLTEAQHITLVFTSLSPTLQRQFELGGIVSTEKNNLRVFPDLDHGVEWIENQILTALPSSLSETFFEEDDRTFLTNVLDYQRPSDETRSIEKDIIQKIMRFLEHRHFEAGEYLIHQGNPPVGIFIIKSGRVTAQLEAESGRPIRLRTMSAGTVIGELGVYLGIPATASVVANETCTAFYLSPHRLQEMEENAPKAAAVFHKFIIRILGERLSNSNTTLRELMK